jgi:trk system potassium uptake protein TrkH
LRSSALFLEVRTAIFAASLVWAAMALLMAAPALTDLSRNDGDWRVFATSGATLLTMAGAIGLATRGPPPRSTQRFGFILVVVLWVATPAAGAIPFALYGLSLTDAIFESVSGFTTTGATVISGLDGAPRGILLWRSLTHLLGGIGILALGLAMLPFLRIGGMQLFSKESSDRGDRPLPRFASFARSLLIVYFGMCALCAMSYASAGMNSFDAITHAMGTVSTGGFANYDASFGHFQDDRILWVGTLFMFLGALPFSLYIAALFGRLPERLDPQAPALALLVAAAVLGLVLAGAGDATDPGVTRIAFNVVSVITTTGFAAGDYTLWGTYAVALFFLLTFLGGAAGSTTGGIKTYRLIVVTALVHGHLKRLLRPHAVTLTIYGGRQVDPAVFRAAMVFLVAFASCLMAFTLALAATGLDLVTAHTAALTSLTNVGPGLGPVIGPAGNFAPLPDTAKWLCSAAMLLGRLEILPVLVVLLPDFWRS